MANVLLIIDPEPARRTAFLRSTEAELAFLPGLASGHWEHDTLAVRWAAAPTAPVSTASHANGSATLVIGEPIDASGVAMDAASLGRRYAADFVAPPTANGFHAVVHHDSRAGTRIEADVLGLFPIYYWQAGPVLLAGSSPALFRRHPLFPVDVDLHGVAALLLTSGVIGGHTLLRGVRRLGADHTLFFHRATGATERLPAAVAPLTDAPRTIDAAVAAADALHRKFLSASLAGSRRPGLLLSGGLDSRLLAGIATSLGHRPQCVTFGRERDLDAACATRVARCLDLPQTRYEADAAAYPDFARHSIGWEQLSGGLYAIPMGWNLAAAPRSDTPDRMICGLTLDAVIGGAKHVVPTGPAVSFASLRAATLGFDDDELRQLIRDPALHAACDDVRATFVQSYRSAADDDVGRAWRANLLHRQRFPVGACAWRYAFHAWPVLPALDRGLIALAASLPAELTRSRRVQTTMLTREFPALAALDLDRNYYDTRPLLAAAAGPLADARRRFVKTGRRLLSRLGAEPRFYVRVMDINSPGWRSVRAVSENARTRLAAWFDLGALARILPGPQRTARRRTDPIVHATPLKNTVGLMAWLAQHT